MGIFPKLFDLISRIFLIFQNNLSHIADFAIASSLFFSYSTVFIVSSVMARDFFASFNPSSRGLARFLLWKVSTANLHSFFKKVSDGTCDFI